jgi:sulfatase modifying factor 1
MDRNPWGDEFRNDGKWMANSHQGHFPNQDTGADLFRGIAPVAQFPPNRYGLYDVGGNVWEWTSDWYRPDYYAQLLAAGGVARNPRGPTSSFDPSEPGQSKRVHRGGSYLCTDQYCSRYMVGTRGKGRRVPARTTWGFVVFGTLSVANEPDGLDLAKRRTRSRCETGASDESQILGGHRGCNCCHQ